MRQHPKHAPKADRRSGNKTAGFHKFKKQRREKRQPAMDTRQRKTGRRPARTRPGSTRFIER